MSVSSASTIAAMQAIHVPADGDIVEVAGYYVPLDGGGGIFQFFVPNANDQDASRISTVTSRSHVPQSRTSAWNGSSSWSTRTRGTSERSRL